MITECSIKTKLHVAASDLAICIHLYLELADPCFGWFMSPTDEQAASQVEQADYLLYSLLQVRQWLSKCYQYHPSYLLQLHRVSTLKWPRPKPGR